jgi:Cu/Ag efflux protein CusF
MTSQKEAKMKHTKSVLSLVPLIVVVMLTIVLGSAAQTNNQQANVKHYKMQGTVKSVDNKDHKLTVQHGDIPGFMAAMTMAYPAGKTEDLSKVAPGDQIQADVAVSDSDIHLENIKVTSHAKAKDAKDNQK